MGDAIGRIGAASGDPGDGDTTAFEQADFAFDHTVDAYTCPAGKALRPAGGDNLH